MPSDKAPKVRVMYDLHVELSSLGACYDLGLGKDYDSSTKVAWLDDIKTWANDNGLSLEYYGINYRRPYISIENRNRWDILKGIAFYARKHNLVVKYSCHNRPVYTWFINWALPLNCLLHHRQPK
jgi:hypothetical protein